MQIRAGDQQTRLQGLGDAVGARGDCEKVEWGAIREESESERRVDRRRPGARLDVSKTSRKTCSSLYALVLPPLLCSLPPSCNLVDQAHQHHRVPARMPCLLFRSWEPWPLLLNSLSRRGVKFLWSDYTSRALGACSSLHPACLPPKSHSLPDQVQPRDLPRAQFANRLLSPTNTKCIHSSTRVDTTVSQVIQYFSSTGGVRNSWDAFFFQPAQTFNLRRKSPPPASAAQQQGNNTRHKTMDNTKFPNASNYRPFWVGGTSQ